MTCTGFQKGLLVPGLVSGVSCEKQKRAIYQMKQTARRGILYQKEMYILILYTIPQKVANKRLD